MAVLTEFAMFPTDKGSSVSEYVSKIIKMFKEGNVTYQLTPMGTLFETETMKEALKIVQDAYNILEPHTERIYSVVKFDVKKNKSGIMNQKLNSVESKIGNVEH